MNGLEVLKLLRSSDSLIDLSIMATAIHDLDTREFRFVSAGHLGPTGFRGSPCR